MRRGPIRSIYISKFIELAVASLASSATPACHTVECVTTLLVFFKAVAGVGVVIVLEVVRGGRVGYGRGVGCGRWVAGDGLRAQGPGSGSRAKVRVSGVGYHLEVAHGQLERDEYRHQQHYCTDQHGLWMGGEVDRGWSGVVRLGGVW